VDTPTLLLFLLGLGLLVGGAELLVRGAASLARRFSVPPLIIGLTVVAYGTSAPELAVSIRAALAGRADIAVGNVVGSNLFNVLFILGLSALITPLAISVQLVRFDVPILIAVSLLVPLAAADGRIEPWEGAVLVLLGLAYTIFLVRQGRKEGVERIGAGDIEAAIPGRPGGALVSLGQIAAGLVGLVLGARWLVAGAVTLAASLGVDERVIGLTLVAAGTSLPEVATSLVAAARGQRDIAVGNVVGSNLFNILWVLGMAAAVSGGGVAVARGSLFFDIPVMVGAAVVCLPLLRTGFTLERWEGALLFSYWLAYTVYIVLAVRSSPALPWVGEVLGIGVGVSLLVLAVALIRSLARPTPEG